MDYIPAVRISLITCVACIALTAAAAPPLLVDLDGDGRPERASLRANGELLIERDGAIVATAPVGMRAEQAHLGRAPAGQLVVRGPGRLFIGALAGDRLQIIYNGPVGPVGRDGERTIEVDVGAEIIRYQTAPGITRCDGERRLFAERYTGGRWAPLPMAADADGAEVVRATTSARLPDQPLPVYSFVAASAQAGITQADLLAPPAELQDGRPETGWLVDWGGGEGRGAFVTARASGPDHRIAALRFVPLPARKARRPRRLLALFGDRSRLHIELADTAAPQYVILDAPRPAQCLSLVLLETWGRAGATGVAEVSIYTEADTQGPAGLVRLAASESTAAAAGAVRTLELLFDRDPAAVLQALAGALEGAQLPQTEGRRRLHRLLAEVGQKLARKKASGLQASLRPRAAALLAAALPAAHEGERRGLLSALAALGGPQALLQLLDGPLAPPVRREVLSGLQEALRCRPPHDADVQRLWERLRSPSPQDAELIALLSRAAAGCADEALRRDTVARLCELWPGLVPFPARYRALQGLGFLGVFPPAAAALLRAVLSSEPDEVLRRTVAAALPPDPGAAEFLGLALRDADPGVRLAALSSPAARAAPRAGIDQLLLHDPWPQIRRAAAEAHAAACLEPAPQREDAALRRALSDADDEVRRQALLGLARCEGVRAGALVHKLLLDPAAAPPLRSLAAALLPRVLPEQAAPVLEEALAGVLGEPDERLLGLAISCVRALGRLGKESSRALLSEAAAPTAPEALRREARQALSRLPPQNRLK
jgi:hypothetical protein